ncbi:hypothetical protein QBC32DRAFT_81341 [Pseudoneurospora amorphoporcata]|uniref:Uncharacterized protein n=1 Tax=Pseudoneurospora amorphoporcata TaxID=241081 RepID=A0AAN6NP01_9PEZI|nr:hypothetical protein QBC32DRAFT_81341 [Pseudoneurospora amorphoporcata]
MNHLFQVILILLSTCPEHARTTDTPDSLSPKDILSKHRNDTEFLSTTIAPPWVDSPNTRGTGDILFTCLLTLVACIYTAIHPHVPGGLASRSLGFVKVSSISWVKAIMAIEALIVPELLLFGALTELIEARSLRSDLKQIISRRKVAGDPDEALIDYNFCYYATMGGFRVHIEDIHPSHSAHLPSSSTRCLPTHLALSPNGIRLLAELGHLSLLVKHASDVGDKSKADTFQKCLAASQLSWMVIQCIVRKAQGLPISLLEVHTSAHALFSFLQYCVWLKKPLDIAPSTCAFLPTDDFEDALALMVQEQFCESHNFVACLYPEKTSENEFSTDAVSGDPKMMPPFDKSGSPALTPVTDTEGQAINVTWIDPTSPLSEIEMNPPKMVLPCGFGFAKMFAPPVAYHGYYSNLRAKAFRTMDSPERRYFLTRKDKLRVKRAMRHIALLDERRLTSPEPYVNCKEVHPKGRRCRYPTRHYHRAFYWRSVITRPRRLYIPDEPESGERKFSALEAFYNAPLSLPTFGVSIIQLNLWLYDNLGYSRLLIIASLFGLNAAIHLAAWNYLFPTKIEGRLWRAVNLVTAGMGLALVLGRLLIGLTNKLTGPRRLTYRLNGRIDGSWLHLLEVLLLVTPAYAIFPIIIGRLYLNVEAFISLRHMPYGVFVMPSWLEVWPHL